MDSVKHMQIIFSFCQALTYPQEMCKMAGKMSIFVKVKFLKQKRGYFIPIFHLSVTNTLYYAISSETP